MTEEVLSMTISVNTTYQVWCSLEEQLLPNTKENEAQLKDNLYALTKGSLALEEYIRKFKNICDKLSTIGKLVTDRQNFPTIKRPWSTVQRF